MIIPTAILIPTLMTPEAATRIPILTGAGRRK